MNNKVVEIVFQIFKVTKDLCIAVFSREDGSLDAFDEVLTAMHPIMEKFKYQKP